MDSELRKRAKRWLWGPGGDIAEFCSEGHEVIEGLLKEIDRLEEIALTMTRHVSLTAAALRPDSLTFTSPEKLAEAATALREKCDRLERELAKAPGFSNGLTP